MDNCRHVCLFCFSEIREDDRVLVNDSEMVVAKPSPKTLLGAEIIMSLSNDKTNRKDTLESESEKEVDDANEPVRKSTDQLVKTSDVNVENPSFENRGNVPRPSLMERNRTACTYEVICSHFHRIHILCYPLNVIKQTDKFYVQNLYANVYVRLFSFYYL